MTDPIRIRGGAGPELAAAITATVMFVLAEEALLIAAPRRRPELGPWASAERFATLDLPRTGDPLSGYANTRYR